MKPFYTWLGSVTAFLLLAATPALLPFTLPVPWTGLALLLLVSTVGAVPFFYGSVYIRGSPLLLSRGPSMDSDGGMEREERRGSDLAPCEFRLEDDLFGREHHPLLGGADNGNGTHASLGRVTDSGYGYTWKECLQVRVVAFSRVCKAGQFFDNRGTLEGKVIGGGGVRLILVTRI